MPVDGEFQLESSQAANLRWNIQPYFDFPESGSYQVTARYRTQQKVFEQVTIAQGKPTVLEASFE